MVALLLGAAVFAVLAAGALAPLEAWFPRVDDVGSRRAIVVCAALLVAGTVCMRVIGAPVLAAAHALAPAASASALPAWLRIALALVLGDVIGYGLHRAMHRVPWLWRLHRVHHVDVDLHFWEAWRLHPLELVLHTLAVGVPGALLDAPFADYVGLVLARKTFTAYLHANVAWHHGPVSWLLASPAWHAAHHRADERGEAGNFAALFPFLDRMFGTDIGTGHEATVSATTALSCAEAKTHTDAVGFGSD